MNTVYILASSGGRFPNQLALFHETNNILKNASCIASSSGGNLAAYIALAGNFENEGIDRIIRGINSKLFNSSWFPSYLNFLPSALVGLAKGSIYQKGAGSEELMQNIFTKYNISRIEILTGTTARASGKQQIFSNKEEKESIMKDIPFDYKINNSLPIIYLNGDIEKITLACQASAAIPIYVPDIIIEDKGYVDGGLSSWSPLTVLADSFDFIGNTKKTHVNYFNGNDIESDLNNDACYNIIQNTDNTISRMIKSSAVQDRLKGIDFVKKNIYRNKDELLYFEGKCDKEILKEIEKAREYTNRTFLELYTPLHLEIDISNFKYEDIMCNIEKVRKCYCFRIWIACNKSNVEKINSILGKYISDQKEIRSTINSAEKYKDREKENKHE